MEWQMDKNETMLRIRHLSYTDCRQYKHGIPKTIRHQLPVPGFPRKAI